MAQVGKELGRILAQKMPNPKAGTVSANIAGAIRDIKAGKVEFRLDKTGIIHTIVGKANFEEAQLLENVNDAARRDRSREAGRRKRHLSQERDAHEHDGTRRQGRSEPHTHDSLASALLGSRGPGDIRCRVLFAF